MTISAVTARGTIGERVSDTSLAISPSAAITVGKIAYLAVTADNIAIVDGASSDHSVADTDGHVWTKVYELTENSGQASSGLTNSLWLTKVTSEIGTGDVVTVTFTSAILSKTAHIGEFTVAGGQTFNFETPTHTPLADATTSGSAVLSGLTSRAYLWFGHLGMENDGGTVTNDADYAVLAESISGTGGGTNSNVALETHYRLATLTGDTFGLANLGTGEKIISLIAIYEESFPAAPVALTASRIASDRIDLDWTDIADNEDGFIVERSLNGTSGWTQISDEPADVEAFSDEGLSPLTEYFYRVKAYHAGGSSAYTSVASATTFDLATVTVTVGTCYSTHTEVTVAVSLGAGTIIEVEDIQGTILADDSILLRLPAGVYTWEASSQDVFVGLQSGGFTVVPCHRQTVTKTLSSATFS